MAFEGYREDRIGNWFGGGTQMIYIDESNYKEKKEPEFYIINEQNSHLIRIRNKKQIELMRYCMFGPQLDRENIEWLISKAGFKYYDSVDDYISYQEGVIRNL